MRARTATAFLVAGGCALLAAVAVVVDVVPVAALTASGLTTGVALAMLWRDPPVPQGTIWLLVAAAGAVGQGVGTALAHGLGVEVAVMAIVAGGTMLMLGLLAAGLGTLVLHTPMRWSGMFLVAAVPGGVPGLGLAVMGVSWLAFSAWIRRHQNDVPGPSARVPRPPAP